MLLQLPVWEIDSYFQDLALCQRHSYQQSLLVFFTGDISLYRSILCSRDSSTLAQTASDSSFAILLFSIS